MKIKSCVRITAVYLIHQILFPTRTEFFKWVTLKHHISHIYGPTCHIYFPRNKPSLLRFHVF